MELAMLISNGVLMMYIIYVTFLKPKPRPTPVINLEINSAYETWLDRTIALYTTQHLENVKAENFQTDSEISINGDFAVKGINTVSTLILENMPDAYLRYMGRFYGEDKLVAAIHTRVKSVFIYTISNIRAKRLAGGNASTNEITEDAITETSINS